jgi:hypothetical protein
LKSLDDLVDKLQNIISSSLYPESVSIILFDDEFDVSKPLKVTGLETELFTRAARLFFKVVGSNQSDC